MFRFSSQQILDVTANLVTECVSGADIAILPVYSLHWQVTDPVMANVQKTDEKKSEEATEATPVPETAGEKFTFFFGAESPFSQWHPAVFTLDGVEYNCAEQYMMSQKAGQSCGLARTEAGKAWKQGEFN